MAVIHITYSGDESTRFDRDYYRNHHLPLVMQCWKQYGLESLSVLYPEALGIGTIAICECKFRDEAAITASFESAETPRVMADVKHFTDVTPTQTRAIPL